MLLRYVVSKGLNGWRLMEGDQILHDGVEKQEAVQLAILGASAGKAAGGRAVLFVENEIGMIESMSLSGSFSVERSEAPLRCRKSPKGAGDPARRESPGDTRRPGSPGPRC